MGSADSKLQCLRMRKPLLRKRQRRRVTSHDFGARLPSGIWTDCVWAEKDHRDGPSGSSVLRNCQNLEKELAMGSADSKLQCLRMRKPLLRKRQRTRVT